jgi:hypothetical protein
MNKNKRNGVAKTDTYQYTEDVDEISGEKKGD